jgi:hypothetical protein
VQSFITTITSAAYSTTDGELRGTGLFPGRHGDEVKIRTSRTRIRLCERQIPLTSVGGRLILTYEESPQLQDAKLQCERQIPPTSVGGRLILTYEESPQLKDPKLQFGVIFDLARFVCLNLKANLILRQRT